MHRRSSIYTFLSFVYLLSYFCEVGGISAGLGYGQRAFTFLQSSWMDVRGGEERGDEREGARGQEKSEREDTLKNSPDHGNDDKKTMYQQEKISDEESSEYGFSGQEEFIAYDDEEDDDGEEESNHNDLSTLKQDLMRDYESSESSSQFEIVEPINHVASKDQEELRNNFTIPIDFSDTTTQMTEEDDELFNGSNVSNKEKNQIAQVDHDDDDILSTTDPLASPDDYTPSDITEESQSPTIERYEGISENMKDIPYQNVVTDLEEEENPEQDYPLNDVVMDQDIQDDISADNADVDTDFTSVMMTDAEDVDEGTVSTNMKQMDHDLIVDDFASEVDSAGNIDRMDFADAYDEEETALNTGDAINTADNITLRESLSESQPEISAPQEILEGNESKAEESYQVLRNLSYSEEEIAVMKPSVIQVIAKKLFKKPRDGVPPEFLKEGEVVPSTEKNGFSIPLRKLKSIILNKEYMIKMVGPTVAVSITAIAAKVTLSHQKDTIFKDSQKIQPVKTIRETKSVSQKILETDSRPIATLSSDEYLKRKYI